MKASRVIARFRFYLLRPWKIPSLIPWGLSHAPYTTWDGKTITWGHLGLLGLWLIANIMIVMNWKWLSPLGPPGRRAALAAALNLIPVILGGRTCHVADFLGLSLHFYYLLHHWLARIALLQTVVHAGIHIHQQERWTVQSGMGIAAMLLFIIITCSSFFYVRRKNTVMFVWCHKALAYLSLGFLLTHLWLVHPLNRRIAGIGLLFITAISLLIMLHRWFRRQKAQADVAKCLLIEKEPDTEETADKTKSKALAKIDTGAARVKFRLPTDIRIYPGAYFYIFYHQESFWRRHLGVPMMVYTWPMSNPTSWTDGKSSASELTFLVEDRPYLAPLLSGRKPSITIDGPYGRDLRLGEYDHVFLLAEGIGIAAVIPFAFALAHRRQYDRLAKRSPFPGSDRQPTSPPQIHMTSTHTTMPTTSVSERTEGDHRRLHLDKTRRVTLIWAMEESSQLEWARDEINQLMNLDPPSALLHVYVYQPTEPDPTKPSQNNVQQELEACNKFPKHCKLKYLPKNHWAERLQFQMEEYMRTSPGTIVTAVSGTPVFRQVARNITRENPRATFYELEHQPVPRSNPDINLPPEVVSRFPPTLPALPQDVRRPVQVMHRENETSMAGSVKVVQNYEHYEMSIVQKRQLTGNNSV
ncbi:hypothetical protein EDB81DRAFT_939855 [Dactylonectria macrodidyma]|uniref:FAD-binding FR-type domain-containing protein n=1 Tax=Dactylonectria macrodidyma TaxID=307937 RepID=A0A9P9FTK5_9HYPO|nr:hypothetical protein EDB81DRAFT_939855 [Dactylonectria macrodidyma]